MFETCPLCSSPRYGVWQDGRTKAFQCGSGFVQDAEVLEDLSESTGCAIIQDLLTVPHRIADWLRSDECYDKYVEIMENNFTTCEPDDLADAIERGEFLG